MTSFLLCAALLATASAASAFQKEELTRLPLSQGPAAVSALKSPELITIRSRLAPGEAMPVHCHPFVGTVYVLEGEIEVTNLAGETTLKKAGDSSPELLNVWHTAKNPSADHPTVLLVTFVAEPGKPLMLPRSADNQQLCKDK